MCRRTEEEVPIKKHDKPMVYVTDTVNIGQL